MSATFFRSSAAIPWKAVMCAASASKKGADNFTRFPSLFIVILVTFPFRAFLPGLLFELFRACPGEFGVSAVAKIIKQRRAVGFGPNAHFSGILEGIVFPNKGLFSIECDNEIVILKIHAQGVPLVRSDFRVDAFL